MYTKQGGRRAEGAAPEEHKVEKKSHVSEFKAAQLRCIQPVIEGKRQSRKLDAMRRMHKMQFYESAGPSGKVYHTVGQSVSICLP